MKKLLLGLFMISFLSFVAEAQVKDLRILHDNPEWQKWWTSFGEASAQDIGVRGVPTVYETDVYQAKVKVDLTTDRAPGVFKWWFGYRAYELLKAGLVADLGDVWKEIGSNYAPG